MKLSFYDYKEFIDWDKVRREIPNQDEAHDVLVGDFYLFEMDDDGNEVWAFRKWFKTNNSKLDPILAKIDEELGYNIKDQGRS